MSTLQDYITQVQELIHDLASIDFSTSEYTSRINLARQRVALDLHCVRVLFANLQTVATVEQYPIQGGIGGCVVLSGGQNYVAPIVKFSGGGGSGATAVPVFSGGVITAINMTSWGQGYTSTPAVTIVDGAGWVTNFQFRQALAAVSSTAIFNLSQAIIALPPGDPVFIQWNSGAGTIPGDGLALLTAAAVPMTQTQLAAVYAAAGALPTTPPASFTQTGAATPISQGQTGQVNTTVTNQQFRLALADPSYNAVYAFSSAVSANVWDPANILWNSGAPSSMGDALSNILSSSTGFGFTSEQVAQFYAFAATMPNSIATVTNQQLRMALADPSYAMISAVTAAISSSVADPVNIQWNSGAGSSFGDALSSLIGTLTFPIGKSLMSLYTFAATFPRNTPGTGAAAQAISLHNVFDIHTASVVWGTERPMMYWFPFSVFQAYCRANTANPQGRPSIWSNYTETNKFFLFRVPDQTYGLELDCICMPDPLVNVTDVETQIPLPVSDAVQFYAAHLCFLKLQQYQAAEYWEAKYKRRILELNSSRRAPRRINQYYSWNARLGRMT